MKTNDFGVDLIKQFEGLVDGDPTTPGLDPYICPTGFVTIGYGHVLRDAGGAPFKGESGLSAARKLHGTITKQEAEDRLTADLAKFEGDVRRLTRDVELNENQFSALVSFTFNLGATAFAGSTLLKRLKDGNFSAASDEFGRWVKGDVNGVKQTLQGLIRRREAERQLFLRPVKPLSKSRTILASAGTIAATAATVVAEIAQEVGVANVAVEATGTETDLLKYILAGLAMAGAVFTIYARIDDRVRKGH